MRMAINKTAIAIAFAGLLSSSANAWMEDWAPAFNCTPAAAEKLSETNVSNFVSKVRFEEDSYWQYCEGYKLDLNGDGIKDFVYILPWRGCGLSGDWYCAHFRVSAGANGWTGTIINGYNISKEDLVNVSGKVYFRNSYYCGDMEKSAHNHWVYEVFSFDKNGVMICSNSDFGKLFPAVTIFYNNPKFKQIELTSGDRKKIEEWGKARIQCDAVEKVKLDINPASKKKEADDWKPPRTLSAKEAAKLIQIMTKRFGRPACSRKGCDAYVYFWRFEGDEWLSVGVSTTDDNPDNVIAIHYWEWSKKVPSAAETE